MDIGNPGGIMLKGLEDACGLTAYAKTLDFDAINIATDKEYQKNFTGYYRVRRDGAWLKKYYEYMEEHKNDTFISFEQILRHLSSIPHRVKKSSVNPTGFATSVDASYSSKMLATINPDYPVWDSQVVRALGITIDNSLRGEDKIQAYIRSYAELTEEIRDFISTQNGRDCIEIFDSTFPSYANLNPFKKIDFFLWNIGK
ncbi:MAG: hypothetical protein J6B29_01560 [Clostridia bacterium]|nr:hypothetical protein [Clostridia bacterium]